MDKIILTGANGFVGRELDLQLVQKKLFSIIRVMRLNVKNSDLQVDFSTDFNVRNKLSDVKAIIHCVARVHIMDDRASNPLDEFRKVNTYGTLNLAQQAADAGVKRFIFVSSIKVNGESTEHGKPFKPEDNNVPTDPYGLSKYEAEVGLRKIAEESGMEVVIIRPPLVYGPNVKANFASMMKWVNKGLPLPLGRITQNKRSMVSVDNLADLIITCIDHPKAANQTFLVSDNNDISTKELLQNMATALSVPSRLIPIPASCFNLVCILIGKPAISKRLCGSLQVDISKTIEVLDWTPPYTSIECMKKTADTFLVNLSEKK